jgi:hypothetical protein
MQHGELVTKGVDVDGLGDQIAELAAHIDAAMHGLLTAIREFDHARGWAQQGALSCAHWLAWRIGWDLTTAPERLRVAKKLGELPIVDEELRLGAMSYSKARAISRVATASNEQRWVEYAKRMPASGLDNLCRSFASVVGNVAMQAEHVAAKRAVTRHTRDDGMVKIELILTNDEAAMVWAAINATTSDANQHASAEASAPAAATSRATLTIQRADTVMAIFHERVRGNRPQRSPVELIVTVPLARLHASAEASPQHLAMTADGEPLAAATARRLCCDAGGVTAVVDSVGQPLSVGRKTRTIPTAINRALLLRDRTCRFLGARIGTLSKGTMLNTGLTVAQMRCTTWCFCVAHIIEWCTKVVFVLRPTMRPPPTARKLGVFSTWFRHNRSERPAAWTGYATTMHGSPSPRGPTHHSGPGPQLSTTGALSIYSIKARLQ